MNELNARHKARGFEDCFDRRRFWIFRFDQLWFYVSKFSNRRAADSVAEVNIAETT